MPEVEDKSTLSKKKIAKSPKRKKSTKGALIKGMSKRLPAEILNDPAFEEGLASIMKGYSGIYALYRRNKLYYAGLTKDLQGRINRHQEDRHAGKWDSFVIFRIERVNYLKDVETLLLRVAEPPGNKSKGNVPRDANLNRVLREIQRERERALRRIRKALK
jgi:hypothetical protein